MSIISVVAGTSGCVACSAASRAATAFAQACNKPEPLPSHRSRFCDDHRFDPSGNPREGDEQYQAQTIFDDYVDDALPTTLAAVSTSQPQAPDTQITATANLNPVTITT